VGVVHGPVEEQRHLQLAPLREELSPAPAAVGGMREVKTQFTEERARGGGLRGDVRGSGGPRRAH